mmetsp:Transcript_17377/g.51278  ORF Transcript_17377/g.51278 Transcript_17377/m.51278 type:complete len:348 (+) Transcript_17377:120-1163(+)
MRGGYRHIWLLWTAFAVVACLPPIAVPPLLALGLSAFLVMTFVCINISGKQMFVSLMFGILDVFFREFVARNQFKVPLEGTPVIFVCAPHANQFLDPFVVMCGVGRSDVSFLTAANSMRKRFVGALARLLQSIPVERGQDLAFSGTGRVWLSPEDGRTLLGRGTRFTEQLKPKDAVAWRGVTAQVESVLSDEKLTLQEAAPPPTGEWSEYKIQPRVDQSLMFVEVYKALGAGKAVAIFPEGGSHVRQGPSVAPAAQGGHRHHGARRDHARARAAAAAGARRPQLLLGPPLPLARLPRHRRALLRTRRAGAALRARRREQARGDRAADGARRVGARVGDDLGDRLRDP